ncbi:DUF2332 domain-containing protein [Nocardioides sp. CFH 31398]|uniref:DUF2332 domain-containing protein n=1 Tax=Nocardioides sp. CFH 31398 TaxID=2919579 RepID=UPI001F05BD73|nr:DUF2332 domain-containing protein [Nocardioides sp. CFH 31398]MCH1867917.1 DUF2332 domain-containing protein [Nocardioides sp. CFH 31398]
MQVHADVAEQYADFAAYADGDSPCFAAWARGAAEDREVLAWLADLPVPKRQPNLVFAAARWHGLAAPAPYAALRDALLGDDGTVAETVRARSTQTNEVGRVATLLPALGLVAAATPGPLALVEVGASAGLCLYPDRVRVRWQPTADGVDVGEPVELGAEGPRLDCRVAGTPPYPASAPRLAWRGGIDLNPLDVTDDDAMAWLATLVWPEQEDRRVRLAEAVAVARADPPVLVRGDLLAELPALVAMARAHGRVVVQHSAVAAYLTAEEREAFVSMMTDLVADGACHWLSNEGKDVLPTLTATGPAVPADLATFVLALDGRAVAWTHGHGRSMTWL